VAATRGDLGSVEVTRFADQHCRIATSAHERYPIEVGEDERAFVCFEGRAYGSAGAPEVEQLLALAPRLSAAPAEALAALRAWVVEWSGEFVALVYLKRESRLLVLGDSMGRLPLYRALDAGPGLALSRDQRFLLELEGGFEADRIGIAQLLLFGFPLGRRTLARGLEHLRAGDALCADREATLCSAGPWDPARLGRGGRGDTLEDRAADLTERFAGACRVRAAACDPPLLGLSGGLDSRAVAAGLAHIGQPFECYTFLDATGVHARDAAAARAVAEALGVPWRRVDAPAPCGRALLRILEMKIGLNSLAMSYSVPVFEALHAALGNRVTLWTGDGGDKMMPDHRPRLGAGDLVRYLVDHLPLWPLAMACRLTGVGERELCDSVAEVVAGYPERSADAKFLRFGLAERGGRWGFEGEDSNRHYFWTVSPFYDRDFARAALACPDALKSGYRLYRAFLRRLQPTMLTVPDANLGLRVDTPTYVLARRLRETARRFPRLRRWLRQGVPASLLQPPAGLASAVLERQIERSPAVRAVFPEAALRAVARAPRRFPHGAVDALLTATSAVERIAGGTPTLKAFADERFG
jgi:asparagine synthase (glutamine-hydrolysing)